MKRLFDVAASGVALVLLAPLWLVLAVAVRFSSPGPVLFRQERVGLDGTTFEILKFRSMKVSAGGPAVTVEGDARITRVGAFLRDHKLDELPQLWNVFVGDMSLVGPRPEVREYVDLWTDHERQVILSVRPGITDPTSLLMFNESELLARADDPIAYYAEEILPQKARMYVDYVASRSLRGDFGIILQTIKRIF
ncbi:sugar transferase [Marmoricola sp. RAF53]|uniref:sugar transferase n=1 Tax=Marmoricola sp. RAF53 TaxID=3233059 RepID=UPI003F94F53E